MMATELSKAFTWEIKNFSEKTSPMKSPPFTSGGCEWHVLIHPKGDNIDDHLSMYLCATKPESLKPGWKRRASFGFVLQNQSGKVLYTTSEGTNLFRAEVPGWGFRKAVPLSKLDIEMVENDTIIIEVLTKVIEVVHEGDETNKEMFEIGGFKVLASQVLPLSKIFSRNQYFAENIKAKSMAVKSAYVNILLGVNETLHKPPESISVTELSNAESELDDLTEAGFKLDWFYSKLDEVYTKINKTKFSLDRVTELTDSVRSMEKTVRNMDRMLSDLKMELNMEKSKSFGPSHSFGFNNGDFFKSQRPGQHKKFDDEEEE